LFKELSLRFYASAQRNVAGGILVLSCLSVCASQNIVKTISCRVYDTFSPNLHQRCITGQRRTHHNLVLGQKIKVTVAWSMLETALSGLVNTMSWKVLVAFLPNLHQWCIMGQRWMHWISRSKFKVTVE